MEKIIALANQKGGVAKTTSALNLGVGLALKGKRVLLVDADPQGNLTDALGWHRPDELSKTLSTVMTKAIMEQPLDTCEAILRNAEGVDLLPANIELSAVEINLINTISRETVLREALEAYSERYDYIIIDCSPSLGMLTLNALTAADSVIIPVQAQYLPTKGMEQLMRTIARLRKGLNPKLEIDGILITMANLRTNMSREITEFLRSTYGRHLNIFDAVIPFSVKAAEAAGQGKSIYSHDGDGKVAQAYRSLTEEVIGLAAAR